MECPYCGGHGIIAGIDDTEQCEMCGGEGEIEKPPSPIKQSTKHYKDTSKK